MVILHLDGDVVNLMVGVEIHLPFGRVSLPVVAPVVTIDGQVAGIDTREVRVHLLEAAEHLVEGVVLEKEEDNVLDRVIGLLVGIHSRNVLSGVPDERSRP
jgi:hypothetical protein